MFFWPVSTPSGNCQIVTRFGKIHSVLKPGLSFINPLLDARLSVNWFFSCGRIASSHVCGSCIPQTLLLYDPEGLTCLTQDKIEVQVDVVVNFRLCDVEKAASTVQTNLFRFIEIAVNNALFGIVYATKVDDVKPKELEIGLKERLHAQGFEEKFGVAFEAIGVDAIVLPEELCNATVECERLRRVTEQELLHADRKRKLETEQAKARMERQRSEQIEQQAAAKHEMDLKTQRAQSEHKRRLLQVEFDAAVARQQALAEQEKLAIHCEAQANAIKASLAAVIESGVSEQLLMHLADAHWLFHKANVQANIASQLATNNAAVFVPQNVLANINLARKEATPQQQ